MMRNWTAQQQAEEEFKLVNYLISRVTGRASGLLENECLFNMPHDKYFIGNLRSTEGTTGNADTLLQQELMSKIAPLAFGSEFLLSPNQNHIQLEIELSWACYYRVFPTFDEQRKLVQFEPKNEAASNLMGQDTADGLNEGGEDQASTQEAGEIEANEKPRSRRKTEQKDALCPKFRKIPCQVKGKVNVNRVSGQWQINSTAFNEACKAEVSRARLIVINDPDAIKTTDDIDSLIKIPDKALNSEDDFKAAINSLITSVIPEWDWNTTCNIESGVQGEVLSVIFENVSPMPNKSSNRESYLFDVMAVFEFTQNTVRPHELELAPRGFRYDRMVWGRGFNCAVIKESENLYRTTHTPLHMQKRYDSQTKPEALFDVLAQNPVPTLRKILESMQSYLQEWDSAKSVYQSQYGSEWVNFELEFQRDRLLFEAETERFAQGLRLIETNPDVALAFKLTNETFLRTGMHPTKPKTSWRLFQIVFLVTQIPGVAALESQDPLGLLEREMVDIIYFPTGGGKTEAYLGILVFHCFFDRLRGKAAGVTAWLRFPLRLLTLQQTQRMADVIGIAELVRQGQTDSRFKNVAGFSVGYFVGESSSPNMLKPGSEKADDRVAWSRANDPTERDKWKRVVTCPACRTPTVRVDLDEVATRIIHRCTNANCLFPDGKIPIYIVDNEIYRYLPSVIVGTIDKLAGLGNQRKFSLILGAVTGRCVKHGYFNSKCCQDECKDEKQWKKDKSQLPRGLSGPTLFIQDELHLLREGLGTFDGHYETFTQELIKELGQEGPLKIIASSATIEAFERQVEHLYGRPRIKARVFPGIGPRLEQSFYAQTRDYPQRLFLGIIPHNKTILNTILELLEYIHSEVQTLYRASLTSANPYGGQVQPGSGDWTALIDYYLTSLTYFLANRDLSSVRTDVETHVNSNLQNDGYSALNLAELTGSTLTSEVARILETVEQPYQVGNPDAILATSMVSHGVDVDRFNTMIFYGMPRQNAEYIQSSSRVGRSHVGLVLICLHPVRERDQSHYNYFVKYHQFLGQLVEPVAINRWSKFSIERTLPGLFMGILLQLIANNSGDANPGKFYMVETIKKKISTGEITADQFIPLLRRAYRVDAPASPSEQFFNDEIEQRVKQFLDQIVGASSQSLFVSEVLYPQPMRSLRDVDEAIDIELDDTGSSWVSK
jgi:hypothetical protein